MAPRYQSAILIASPCYPGAIAWSNENLVAVASGHLVIILVSEASSLRCHDNVVRGYNFALIMCCLLLLKNPDALEGPRQVVVICHSDPFPIGVVNREGKVGLHENRKCCILLL
jgi:hypothetical protein